MTYRVLDVSEWGIVEPEFRSRGQGLPNPALSFIGAAFKDSGELAGFMVCQEQIHMEPLTLYDPFAFRGLHRCMEAELLRRCPSGVEYFVITKDRTSGMAEAVGIKPVGQELRSKLLMPCLPGGLGEAA